MVFLSPIDLMHIFCVSSDPSGIRRSGMVKALFVQDVGGFNLSEPKFYPFQITSTHMTVCWHTKEDSDLLIHWFCLWLTAEFSPLSHLSRWETVTIPYLECYRYSQYVQVEASHQIKHNISSNGWLVKSFTHEQAQSRLRRQFCQLSSVCACCRHESSSEWL